MSKNYISAMWLSLIIGNFGMWSIIVLYKNLWGVLAFIPWVYCTFFRKPDRFVNVALDEGGSK